MKKDGYKVKNFTGRTIRILTNEGLILLFKPHDNYPTTFNRSKKKPGRITITNPSNSNVKGSIDTIMINKTNELNVPCSISSSNKFNVNINNEDDDVIYIVSKKVAKNYTMKMMNSSYRIYYPLETCIIDGNEVITKLASIKET